MSGPVVVPPLVGLLLAGACTATGPEDTAGPDDTGATPWEWAVPDDWAAYGGCQWGALWGAGEGIRFDAGFLLDLDLLGEAGVKVEVALDDGALKVAWAEGGLGEEWFDVCSDYEESAVGAQWQSAGGTAHVEVVLTGEDAEACFTPFVYEGTVELRDLRMVYREGSGATEGLGDAVLERFGPFAVALGASDCGG
jgi:hypothetical protein